MECRVFDNFADYWSYAKHLTTKQRESILRSLPKAQRKAIDESYCKDGWEDLFIRNDLDKILDEIVKTTGWDLLSVRCKVLSGRDVFVSRLLWEDINRRFNSSSAKHLYYIFGGYRAIKSDNGRDEYKLIRIEK